MEGVVIEKAKYINSGQTVLDRGTPFIINEVRVSTNYGGVVFIDMEGVGHGVYHPDEYLGVGEELARNYAHDLRLANIGRVLPILLNMPSEKIH